jgi:hypothetical protein
MAKRNQQTVRIEHQKKVGHTSKYAQKVRAGNQMYGPGCCAHRVRLDYWKGGEGTT